MVPVPQPVPYPVDRPCAVPVPVPVQQPPMVVHQPCIVREQVPVPVPVPYPVAVPTPMPQQQVCHDQFYNKIIISVLFRNIKLHNLIVKLNIFMKNLYV
jgi:hypothetical protein